MSSENKEIWKKIEDYDYIVSNFGRIKNLKNNNLLKPQDNQNGYLKVCLSKHGKVLLVVVAKDYKKHMLDLHGNIFKKFQSKDISDAVKYNGFEVIKNWLNKTL